MVHVPSAAPFALWWICCAVCIVSIVQTMTTVDSRCKTLWLDIVKESIQAAQQCHSSANNSTPYHLELNALLCVWESVCMWDVKMVGPVDGYKCTHTHTHTQSLMLWYCSGAAVAYGCSSKWLMHASTMIFLSLRYAVCIVLAYFPLVSCFFYVATLVPLSAIVSALLLLLAKFFSFYFCFVLVLAVPFSVCHTICAWSMLWI